jgi:hypothetical protein
MKRPPEIQAILDAIESGGPYQSIEDVNRMLATRMRDYNASPQDALGGLSPDETNQLLRGDWESTGALRVNDGLSIDNLRDVPFWADARTVLQYVHDAGSVKETAARNLPRAVVAELLPKLAMPKYADHVAPIAGPPPRNEPDVRWLPALRHTLMFAGLLMRRKGLRLTAAGRDLIRDERAGALFALLFRTFFQRLNLGVLTRFDNHPGLQSTIAYSFYRLRSMARDWASPEALTETAWLDSAKDPPTPYELQFGSISHYTFRQRVLDPLVQFGLVERKLVGIRDRLLEVSEYRLLPLFDRALSFQFSRAGSQPVTTPPRPGRYRH